MTRQVALLERLRRVVGRRHVLSGDSRTRRFTEGYRFGAGKVLAVVRPGSLLEQWDVFTACCEADVIVIVQAANTGLTGGSTPDGDYDGDVVIINVMRIDAIRLIRGGTQAVCFSGATLSSLEQLLRPLGREPHSVIGSSCLGASIVGGICNNSGGALVRRGPAYTEYALYAQVDESGRPKLVNHLGIALGEEPRAILRALDDNIFGEHQVRDDSRMASAQDYEEIVRDIDAPTPARFNADEARLFEVAGCAGKVMALAVRVDTFPAENAATTFYVGTNSVADLGALRRHLLSRPESLPISAEYIHRDAYILAEKYGKDTVRAIELLGTDRLPSLFATKARVDSLARALPFLSDNLSDQIMQFIGKLLPHHLPKRMTTFRDVYEHHLILKVSGDESDVTETSLGRIIGSQAGSYFRCTEPEAQKAYLHRFAVAGAAVRYRALKSAEVSDIIALDIALRRDEQEWFERLPPEIEEGLVAKIYYGHFLCHVFHQDYIVRKGYDPLEIEHRMWELLDQRGARYPAEHNFGHLYRAPPGLAAHYRKLDPTNRMNPGIGQLERRTNWGAES